MERRAFLKFTGMVGSVLGLKAPPAAGMSGILSAGTALLSGAVPPDGSNEPDYSDTTDSTLSYCADLVKKATSFFQSRRLPDWYIQEFRRRRAHALQRGLGFDTDIQDYKSFSRVGKVAVQVARDVAVLEEHVYLGRLTRLQREKFDRIAGFPLPNFKISGDLVGD